MCLEHLFIDSWSSGESVTSVTSESLCASSLASSSSSLLELSLSDTLALLAIAMSSLDLGVDAASSPR
jgi:hypothetical protein